MTDLWPAIAMLALAPLLMARRRLAPVPLSPSWITVGVLLLAGTLGALLWDDVQYAEGGAGIQLQMPAELVDQTALLFAVAALFTSMGAGLYVLARTRVESGSVGALTLGEKQRSRLLLAAAIPLLLVINGDPGGLISRADYLRNGAGGLASLGTQLIAVAVLMIGHLLATMTGGKRLVAVSLGVAYLLVAFSLGTRVAALIPILLALGYYMGARRGVWIVAASAAASVWALQIPLYMRGLTTHGLAPYWASIGDAVAADGLLTSIKNLLVSFPVTGYTAYVRPTVPTDFLYTELNPMPGRLTNWYEIADYQRLNAFTPYSAVGTLGNAGWTWVAVGFLVLGVALGYLDRRIKTLVRDGYALYAFALLGMAALMAALMTQYNLRSTSRLLLYALVFDLTIRWLVARRRRRASAQTSRMLADAKT